MSCSKLTMVVLTVLLLLLVFSLPSDACSCDRKWAPHRLCCRDVVFHGEVQGEKLERKNDSYEYQNKLYVYIREKRVYTFKVREIFKGLDKIKNISQDHNTSYLEIYTRPTEAACGWLLKQHQSYVLSASVNRRNDASIIESNFCNDWQSRWENVPRSYKEFFPMLKTCKCGAPNTNCARGRFFFLLSVLLTVLNIH